MLLTPHTMVGLAIGTAVSNPFLGVPLSIAMHFVGDLVPHWDFYSNTTKEERRTGWRPLAVMADLVCGVSIGLTATLFALWVKHDSSLAINMFLCGIGSVLPDALEGPHIYFHKEPKLLKIISVAQSKLQFQAPLPWGIISQLLVMLFSLLLVLNSLL
jgi:hypothetical protein